MQLQHSDSNTIDLVIPDWQGFGLTGLRPRLWLDGQQNPCEVTDSQPGEMPDGSAGQVLTLTGGVKLLLAVESVDDKRIEIRSWLDNATASSIRLDKVVLFEAAGPTFGQDVPLVPAASGACKLPVITAGEKTEWAVRF